MNGDLVARWRDAVALELESATELRHALHADPRVSGEEADTAATVADAIGYGGGEVVAGTGRLIEIGGPVPTTVALRAELDALPITERSAVPWRSANDAMHACGHDVHLAALTAVVRASRRVQLPARLVAVLQPREEGTHSGARDVADEGWADAWDAVVAAHLQPQLDPGLISLTPGTVNASTTEFSIEVSGKGGHSGYPHTTDDSVLALSAIVVALQQVGGGRVDPVRGCALMVTQLGAGRAANVVPSSAWARGTLRTMTRVDEDVAEETVERIVTSTAEAHGCKGSVLFHPGEPALVNDPAIATSALNLVAGMGHDVTDTWRSFGSDDFSHYAGRTRLMMAFVGTGVDGGGLHDSGYVPSDDYIAIAADALIAGFCAAAQRGRQ